MDRIVKNSLQQKFIGDLNTLTNGTATDGHSATGVHSMIHINPKTKRIVFKRFIKNINDINKYSKANLNCFFTINTFRTQCRNRNNVVGLNGIWADCDVEKNEITKRFFIHFLPDILEEAFLFPPTYVVDSGHGFHLIFLFKHQIKVNHPVMLRLWDRLEENLLRRLKQGIISVCGVKSSRIVDFQAQDCGRLLRTPGTNNLKYNQDERPCYIINYTNHYYDLDFLRRELLDKYNPDKIKKAKEYYKNKRLNDKYHKKSRPELKIKMNRYTLAANRLDDLYTLANLRNYNLPHMRETFLFMLSVFGISAGLSEDYVINKMEIMNDKYKYPLDPSEVSNLEREITTRLSKYCYYNSTIIDELAITDDEQESLKVLINKKEKQGRQKKNRRAKSNGFGPKKKRKIRDKKINKLHLKGISNRRIAKIMNLHRNTINRVIKKSYPK